MKIFFTVAVALSLLGCSPFSPLAKETRITLDEGYYKIENARAGVQSLTFRDFKFATDMKSLRRLTTSKTRFKDILVYAQTTDEPYDFYILCEPSALPDDTAYHFKDTLLQGKRIVLALSKTTPAPDAQFILGKLSQSE